MIAPVSGPLSPALSPAGRGKGCRRRTKASENLGARVLTVHCPPASRGDLRGAATNTCEARRRRRSAELTSGPISAERH